MFRPVILVCLLCFACSKPAEDTSAVDTTLNDTEVAASPPVADNMTMADTDTTDDSPRTAQPSSEDYASYDGETEPGSSDTSPASVDRSMAAAAQDSPAEWISTDDYPPSSIRAEEEGTSAIAWEINTQGRVENCTVTESSGSAALDRAACQAITRRGRYSPRLDESGNPIRSSSSRRVTWHMPAQ